MGQRDSLTTRIQQKLKILSAEDMQHLAERYACLHFPERFKMGGGFRAFSAEGKSRAGWPDRVVFQTDERWHGVEATVAKTKADVISHLKEDLTKAEQVKDNLKSLTFIAGHPDSQLTRDELSEWQKKFADQVGLNAESFNLICAQALALDLTEPKYARLISDILKINIAPSWFKRVKPEVSWDMESVFIPSPKEYTLGLVHRPQIADSVRAALSKDRVALVRGIGASGKTVLARLLALDTVNLDEPAYYLDLARCDTVRLNSGELLNDLNEWGDADTLFIIDNVHLDEQLIAELIGGWQDLDITQKPPLLLLGRELRKLAGSPIEGIAIPIFPLRAQQAEIYGVYYRLASRTTAKNNIPKPPDAVLKQWLQTFGGSAQQNDTTTDLIAFSATVLKRLPYLLQQDWTLSEKDAVAQIRNSYLKELDEKETSNLMRLAVLSELELSLPEEALADARAGFDQASRRFGLVFKEQTGKASHIRYRLAHAALGRLLLAAAYQEIDLTQERIKIAKAYPFIGFTLLHRLSSQGQVSEAQAVSLALLNDSASLLQMAMAKPLEYLKYFLEYAQRTVELKVVFKTLTKDLAKPDNRELLTKRALATPLELVKAFLEYTQRTVELKEVFKTLTKDLAKPINRELLTKQALATPLGPLSSFLEYAQRTTELKEVFKTLTKDLAKPDNRELLTKRALATPLDDLQSFLVFAKTNMPATGNTLITDLQKPKNCQQLSERFVNSQLDELVTILRAESTKALWLAVLSQIELNTWQQQRSRIKELQVKAFISFQRLLTDFGRAELAATPALNLVRNSTPAQWHSPGIGLSHLSHVLRYARLASTAEISQFLARIATPQWLDQQFTTGAKTGGLAGSCFALASNLPVESTQVFLRASLENRVLHELRNSQICSTDVLAEAISLLGAASLLGLQLDNLPDIHLQNQRLLELLLLRKATIPIEQGVGHMQIQLCLGLRELTRHRMIAGDIPSEFFEEMLARWRITQAQLQAEQAPAHICDRYAQMIVWLENLLL